MVLSEPRDTSPKNLTITPAPTALAYSWGFFCMEFDSFLNLDFISCFSVAEWLDDNTDYVWGIFKNDELIGYCTIGIADDELTSFYSKIGFKPLDEPDGNFSGDMVLSISDGRVPRP